jgi:glucose-6-phosphate dehydrogenase assembly protein OpcA
MQVPLGKTLDVEVVEQQLAQLWLANTGALREDDEAAVLRARVANLLVFVASEAALSDSQALLSELTALHPSRVLLMAGLREALDEDIEMSVESICQTDKRTGAKRLSCEEITLKACGKFVVELPSAALPLLVPDLSSFLWWRESPGASQAVFDALLKAADRLILDSADFAEPPNDLAQINKIFTAKDYDHLGISDLNWARLTFWRGLLADFYDVPACRTLLEKIDVVEIDYVAPASAETVAPQALLIAGWLASRLGWELSEKQSTPGNDATIAFSFRGSSPTVGDGALSRPINVKLNRVGRGERKSGRLVRVELQSGDAAAFRVIRSADNLHILAEAQLGGTTQRGRVLPVRNRSAAQLLGREMEILSNDDIYQQAIAVAAKLIAHLR